MQARIHGLVAKRTQALAAVSHDLRTPIARLRLRLDRVEDADERRAIAADLDEMQAMVEATLAYVRGGDDPEAQQVANVASLLMAVADTSTDAGRDVAYAGPAGRWRRCGRSPSGGRLRTSSTTACATAAACASPWASTTTPSWSMSTTTAPASRRGTSPGRSSRSCGWRRRGTGTPAGPAWG